MSFALPANDLPVNLADWRADQAPAFGAALPESARSDSARPGFASLVLRLRLQLRRDNDPARLALLDQILDVAAESEQKLADQQQRIEDLERVSLTDELTGLANRRGFEHHMDQELARARCQSGGGVLGFLDLDGLKGINDGHGHAAGDAALRHAARHLHQAAAPEDFAARLHGDEFALVLPGTSVAAAEARLRGLCAAIRNEPLLWGQGRLPVGLSYGLVRYDGRASLASLLKASDRAMYLHKETRRARPVS
ncbi:GGDEF domain-containing protein [Ferrovibrio sp. MS7]|uniref:GGDEF domain-containing protein n=1 Tax=Ferrovibrio plantarum TaxID=3119164 RepID=UPI003136C678